MQVTAIAACPTIPPGPGRIVLSVFRHSRGSTGALYLSGHPDPIRVTALHPVWSPSHNAWIPAGKLTPRHDVSMWKSTCRVERYELDAREEPVYNVEVDGDHCYRAGQQGLLVHNDSDETPVSRPAANATSSDVENPCDPRPITCGSEAGAEELQDRAQRLFEERGAHCDTVAVIRGENRKTGDKKIFVALNGGQIKQPAIWKLNAGEEWVSGMGPKVHAEENILNNPKWKDWDFIEGGTSRNVCKPDERCGKAITEAGMELGGKTCVSVWKLG